MKTTEFISPTTIQRPISTAQIEQLVHGPHDHEQRQAQRLASYEQSRSNLQAAVDMQAEFHSIPTSQTETRQLRNLCVGCFHDFAAYFIAEDTALTHDILPEQRAYDEQPVPASFVDLRALLNAYDHLEHDPELDPVIEAIMSAVERTPLTQPFIDAYVDARLRTDAPNVIDIYTDKVNTERRTVRSRYA